MSTLPITPAALRVLLVDDEPAIRRALRTPLSEMGFVTTEASRGEEAIHLVQSQTFDVVLLDVNMPGMGGVKTLVKLRALAPRLPILMLTVVDGEEEKDRGAGSAAPTTTSPSPSAFANASRACAPPCAVRRRPTVTRTRRSPSAISRCSPCAAPSARLDSPST